MKLTLIQSGSKTETDFFAPALLSKLLAQCGAGFCMPCGGKSNCKKCAVRVRGELAPPNEKERELLKISGLDGNYRYACMTTVLGDATVYIDNDGCLTVPASGKACTKQGDYTVCIDVGTTTVAAALYLPDGKFAYTVGSVSSQRVFGADVISRLTYSKENGTKMLSRAVKGDIERLIMRLCKQQNIEPQSIKSAVIAGNTAMLYFLCGKNTDSLIEPPFIADDLFDTLLSPESLDIPSLERAEIYLPPCFSSFVGADISAGLTACGLLDEQNHPVLFADIGTNSELVLINGKKITACSTPAGPVFEGNGICCGMTAQSGAISSVDYSAGKFSFKTVDGATACGICGSGIIDAVAALLKSGLVLKNGTFAENAGVLQNYLCEINGETAFRFAGTEVYITQTDIRAFQLAKSALYTGIDTLLCAAGITADDLSAFHLSGGFGSHINISTAVKTGLFPGALAQKTVPHGNTSAEGCALLTFPQNRELCRQAVSRTEVIELTLSPQFNADYINNLNF